MTELTDVSAEEAPAENVETISYRVLRLNTEYTFTCWEEVGTLERQASYFYPTAADLGEKWGEGEYLYFKDDHYGINKLTVVADRTWREGGEDS